MPELTFDFVTLLLVVGGYLLGSVPFGMVMARVMGLGNLRDIGSGNIGATNVLRTGNKKAAFLTLVFDAGKGAVAVLIARAVAGEGAAQLAGLAAFLGHLFPVWLGFKGGKGVATYLGLLLALSFPVGLAACASWLAAAVLLRISSASALASALVTPVWALMLGYGQGIVLIVVLGALIFWGHRANISRLLAGTEPKIGKKS
ncbi:glycerol-3-phosphate 1-O-acyltransferase PlsY [Neptunicoccus cionae]|uniref:glycerol-3-phosphate 1-O-acyltransferase PlsY n=1 Tax=Neptunicoccus cionae TaxID=2035344 RepID=UPI000C75EEE8|nr:glycerol-3-phosphate 1-O-acyltransferase PlsY [Amylibacter cionae]PLS23271.1 acyl-phosphate glycerol 3-phosphate acyltransferase [Amylibacter cionae]